MKLILFGHRGIGKSSLLKRVKSYVPGLSDENSICVDTQIEERTGQSIKELFIKEGEAYFREQEKQILQNLALRLHSEEQAVLAVGAGFEGEIPEGWKVLWVQRAVDPKDFIFTDRPPLAVDDTLGLPLEKFKEREEKYACLADLELEVLEHRSASCPYEERYFQSLFSGKILEPEDFFYMTLPSYFMKDLEFHGKRFSLMNLELRDDRLTFKEMERVLSEWGGQKMISFRDLKKREFTKELVAKDILWDWPVEWGECHFGNPRVHSLHEREASLKKTFERFKGLDGILKLAIPIHNFSELRQGYEWFMEDRENRVFLPCSENGRWQWFRQMTASQMPFSFLREGKGSSPDQPTLLQSLRFNPSCKEWGAILGAPVNHSLTPWFQEKVFGNSLAVEIKLEEWVEAIPLLRNLGLRRAAVTSPLKGKAFKIVDNQKDWAHLGAVNTLYFYEDKCLGSNTDHFGFMRLIEKIGTQKVAVWGGGGVLSAIQKALPEASFHSSRSGELKEGTFFSPNVIIWAVGAGPFSEKGQWPPEDWRPKEVIDLNYSDNSPGVVCADRYGCQYTSGLGMFLAQGEAQQEFWKKHEC